MNEFVESEPGARKMLTCLSPPPPTTSMTPGCALIEMQALGSSTASGVIMTPSYAAATRSNKSSPARSASQQRRARPTELASFDSSDTWASCNPFPSLTDLSGWSPQTAEQKPLYVKPIDEQRQTADSDLLHISVTDDANRLLYSQINTISKPDDSPKSTKVIKCTRNVE